VIRKVGINNSIDIDKVSLNLVFVPVFTDLISQSKAKIILYVLGKLGK
jgi:hypothetical protein